MKLVILSRNPRLYSTRRLVAAADRRDVACQVVDPLRCVVDLAERPEVYFRGRKLAGIDAVLPRIGASISFYGLAVLRQLESTGVVSANGSEAIARSRDKLRALQLLAHHGIAIPKTAFARSRDEVRHAIRRVGGPPVVLKLLEGTQGVGVILAESVASAESVLDAMHSLRQNILIQAFVAEAEGVDYRAVVVGDRVVAAMARHAAGGEFRSNLHRGGTAEPADLPPVFADTALAAARVLGLEVAGVDILPSRRGPLVLEVNSSPGLEGIETATRRDVAGDILDYLIARQQALAAAPR